MNFIKGPVCRGQMAVDVIEDHFWVFFLDPGASALRDRQRIHPASGGSHRTAGVQRQRCGRCQPVAALRRAGAGLPAQQEPGAATGCKPRRASRSVADLGRRRRQPQRGPDDLQALRQCVGGARPGGRRPRRPPGSSATRSSSASTTCWLPATTSTATSATSSTAGCTWTSCAWKASSTSWRCCRSRCASPRPSTGTAVRATKSRSTSTVSTPT